MDIIVNLSQISPNDIDLNWIDISNLTDLTRVFAKLKNLNIDCAKWDTRHVEKFNYIFAFSSNTNIKANNWQFDSAKEFDGMFYMCKKTMNVEIDAEHWNSENVETMKNMFHGCTNQNLLHYASKLDIENCVGFEKMFRHSNCKEDLSSWEISNNLSKTFDISDPFDEWDSMFGGVKTMTIDMLPKLVKNKSQSSDPMKKRFEHDVKRFCEETGSQCIIKINERPGGYQCNDITFPDETTGFLIEYINNRTNKLDEYALWFNYSTIGLDNSTIIGHTLNELIKKANNRFTKRIKKLNKK